MKPTDPISPRKIKLLHAWFHRIGEEGEAAVRDDIEHLTGQRSTKGLNEAQAWELCQHLAERLGERNPEPICVTWAPGYTPGHVPPQSIAPGATRLPSQAQVWALYRLLRGAQVRDPVAWLSKRHPQTTSDGVIRTAEQAWWITKAFRAAAARNPGPSRAANRALRA